MEEQFKVSIIVAVYNAVNYINHCVDSLLAQTYHNIEILLVDDGSIDGSAEICDDYAKKDARVIVIHKSNGGVSTARQTGLDAATGDYVIHADPDDYADNDMVESLLDTAIKTDADLVTCDFFMNEHLMPQGYSDSQDLLKRLVNVEVICVCWNTLVRRSFIKKQGISFTPSWLCMSEDFLFICRLLVAGAKATHLSKAFYHYWVSNSGSLTNKRSEIKLKSIMTVISEMEKLLPAKKYDNFYTRKKYAVMYTYHAKMFHKISSVYPEVHNRMKLEGNWEIRHMFGHYPALVYYISRINFYAHRIINKL